MRFPRRIPAASVVVAAVAGGMLSLAACGGNDEPDVIAPAVAEPAVEVRVTSHEDGETVRRAQVRLEGIVTPGAEVRVNGRRARRIRGGRDEPDRFAVRLTLRRGTNTIRVTAVKTGSKSAVRELVLVRRRSGSRRPEERPEGQSPQPAPQPAPGTGEGAPPPGQGGAPAPAPIPQDPGQGGPPAPAEPPEDQGGPPAPPPLEPGQGGPPAPG